MHEETQGKEKLLDRIDYPKDLRQLRPEDLEQVTRELRDLIVEIVSQEGGHFGGSLGVAELTVALHYVFNTPDDKLVWDVGHQAYGHKILTGRKDQMNTIRKYQGLSGFPKRAESEYDTFGVGHSSTSISAALGMALASRQEGNRERQHVAIIGDGAMTGGMAFEALDHGGIEDSNLLVILNDNRVSIDPNTSALKEYLTDIATSHTYNRVKDDIWKLLDRLSYIGKNAQTIGQKVEHAIKTSILNQSNLFEALNFRYFGPTDGHDVEHLVKVLEDLKDIPGPKLLHCLTKKGKGYGPSERGDETKWHSPGLFNKDTGEIIKVAPDSPQPPKYQDVFGHTIVELAEENERIFGITPAMPSGSSLKIMMEAMPDRAIDVGIAEQHAVTLAAGMAASGHVPFCTIYSTFMQRGYDQVIHDVAIQDLPVVFCVDRAGIVGGDGATHQGAYDIAYMRCIPNMIVSAPMNEAELRNLMFTAQKQRKHPFSIRYPRGQGVMPEWKTPMKEIGIGKGRNLRQGSDIAILTLGHPGNDAKEACDTLEAEGVEAAHYDLRFVKPLDETLLHEVFSKFDRVITVESGSIIGGMGSAVLEFMANNDYKATVRRLGIPDRVIEHGDPKKHQKDCGFDAEGIAKTALELMGRGEETRKEAFG